MKEEIKNIITKTDKTIIAPAYTTIWIKNRVLAYNKRYNPAIATKETIIDKAPWIGALKLIKPKAPKIAKNEKLINKKFSIKTPPFFYY